MISRRGAEPAEIGDAGVENGANHESDAGVL
jgi:hypothetical protein